MHEGSTAGLACQWRRHSSTHMCSAHMYTIRRPPLLWNIVPRQASTARMFSPNSTLPISLQDAPSLCLPASGYPDQSCPLIAQPGQYYHSDNIGTFVVYIWAVYHAYVSTSMRYGELPLLYMHVDTYSRKYFDAVLHNAASTVTCNAVLTYVRK